MASAARDHFDQTQTQPSAAGTLLVQLKEAHQRLLEQMINLRDMTLGPLPDDAVLADARWRIGQASLRRRSLAASIFDFLSTRVDGHDFRSLRTLRLEDQMLLRCSVQHVSTWTLASIPNDWAGYCAALREIGGHMKAYIQTEKNVICPLLERLALRGG